MNVNQDHDSALDGNINSGIIMMAKIEDTLTAMRRNPKAVSYRDLCLVCDFYFGEARQSGSSHRIYKTPWPGDSRVNI